MDRVGKAGGVFPLQAYQNAFNLCLLSVSAAMVISIFLMKMKKAE
jgi:hypothetical protein